jgi:multidrug efflux pump subunit AcrB
VQAAYDRSLGVALRHTGVAMTILALTVALNGYLLSVVPKGFFRNRTTV